MPLTPPTFRAADGHLAIGNQLGPLASMIGTWMGTGWSVIAVPQAGKPNQFTLKVNPFIETLEFSALAAAVPNRGQQEDEFLFGLQYHQRIADAQTHAALHVETGMWLRQPSDQPDRIIRQSVIPHGDSLLAMGSAFSVQGGPQIDDTSSLPVTGPGMPLGYTDPYLVPRTDGFNVINPNQFLKDGFEGQTITHTFAFVVDTANSGGILNIPFIGKNANATALSATFWTETVQAEGSDTFQQLQYTQQINIEFFERPDKTGLIMWPHITVATLVKQ